MISLKNISFCYSGEINSNKIRKAIDKVSLEIKDSSFTILCGPSGCGKTSMTRIINGLIPFYYEGNLKGEVIIDGDNLKDLSLFDLSRKIGSIFQNPRSQFFNLNTTNEIAFGPENHGIDESIILNRIEEISKDLKISDLLNKNIFKISGGEKQKIACASAAAIKPDIYVFDEPSSNLDFKSIKELRKLLIDLKGKRKTVIIAEHRLHYIYDLADQIIYMNNGKIKKIYSKESLEILSKKEREKLGLRVLNIKNLELYNQEETNKNNIKREYKIKNFNYKDKNKDILSMNNNEILTDGITAIIGENGSGKTSFVKYFCGLTKKSKGIVESHYKEFNRSDRLKNSFLVMQDVNNQLFTQSVEEEILLSMKNKNLNKAYEILKKMDLYEYKERHPLSLSGGQKQRVAIATALASDRKFIFFDEPTSGLDLFHMQKVADSIKELRKIGKEIFIITHDPEFILECCSSIIEIKDGKIVNNYFLNESSGRRKFNKFFLYN